MLAAFRAFVFLLLTEAAGGGMASAGEPPAKAPSWAEAERTKYPYLDNRPVGTPERPLLLRTFLPNPGLDETVFAHHHRSVPARSYSPEQGADLGKDIPPIDGIPAAIAVSFGPELSIVFDSTEGRVLYAWQGGFLDMFPYWGDSITRGSMIQMNYLPQLIGTLFYRAAGRHPLEIEGRSVSESGAPRFLGYDLVDGQPRFIVRHGRHTVHTLVRPVAESLALRIDLSVEPPAELSFRLEDARDVIAQERPAPGRLSVTLRGAALETFRGYERALKLREASVAAGRQLYQNYGCASCHNLNGAKSNGPSHVGLFGREEVLADGRTVKVDEAFLLESIKDPNAKIPRGYAPNVMPPYNLLSDLEYQSLVLFIKSLVRAEPATTGEAP